LRYCLALVSVVAAAIVAQVLGGRLLATSPALCAILLTAWYGGVGPGLVAWFLSSLVVGYLRAPAVLDAGLDTGDVAAFLLFCATALLAVWIGAGQRGAATALRRTREDLDAKARDLSTADSALQAEIAHRMRVEASLREGEARLGALAGARDDIVFEFDADGTYLNVWTRNESLLFRPRHELIGRTLAEVFDEGWARHHVEKLRRVLASGEPETWEYRIDLPAGQRWFLGRMAPIPALEAGRRTVATLVRDITEHKRDVQTRAAQHGVMRALAESENLAAAAPALLSAIGENMEWDWGALWTFDREPTRLRCEVIWRAAGFEGAEFADVSRATGFELGAGLPGRVWESGKPEWMLDVTRGPAFLRREAAAKAALRSAVAFPILDLHSARPPGADHPPVVAPAFTPRTGTMEIAESPARQAMGGEVLGIIEFSSRDLREQDEDQLAMLTVIGGQVGQFVKRKRAEAEVRRRERELRDVIETIPAMVWSALPDGSVDFISRRWQEVTGLAPSESLGWEWERAVHPEELDRYVSAWRASLATGEPFETELRLRRAGGGEYCWFMESAVPLRDEQGAIRKWYGVLADIEDRKRAEYLTGQVFESAPDGISIVGTDYRYQRVNPVYQRSWGMPAEKIVGKHVADLLGTKAFEQTIKPNLDRCFAGEEVKYAQWFNDSRGQSYLSVSYSPLRPSSERVEAALVITRDLTEHAVASEALRAAQAELAHVNRVVTMGQLTASIAHEVNQPIAAAVTNAQAGLRWLAARPPDLEEARQTLVRIIEGGQRAGEVIARIRSLVKKAPGREDRLDLNEAIRDVIALTGSEVLKQGATLETDLAEGLPSVTGDRVQLQQVILNLVMNAAEAMRDVDGRPRELLIQTLAREGQVLVAVRDTGVGLDPDARRRIFDAFYTTKPGGMGLGLSISQSIVESHGGRLWVEPNEDHGATFRFTLPCVVR
jgi:PAS domain S-box-containing protein